MARTSRRTGRHAVVLVLGVALAACGGSDAGGTLATEAPQTPTTDPVTTALERTTTTTGPAATVAPTTLPPTTLPPPPPTTAAPTTQAPTTLPPTTLPPPPTTQAPLPPTTAAPVFTIAGELDLAAPVLNLGLSVEGRPLVAERHGTLGGRRVLIIGVIHGDEDDGVAIVDELRARALAGAAPLDGVELWLVESMNPDGQAAQIRQNARGVDLNRNFPYRWGPIGELGDSQYAGVGPASEPETQAMVNFIEQLRPDIAIWYHQDANLVIPSTGRDGRIRARYAELTALPLADCCGGGGIYTGIAATWARNLLKQTSDAVPFIVELPGSLTPEQVATHADAVLTVAREG